MGEKEMYFVCFLCENVQYCSWMIFKLIFGYLRWESVY